MKFFLILKFWWSNNTKNWCLTWETLLFKLIFFRVYLISISIKVPIESDPVEEDFSFPKVIDFVRYIGFRVLFDGKWQKCC